MALPSPDEVPSPNAAAHAVVKAPFPCDGGSGAQVAAPPVDEDDAVADDGGDPPPPDDEDDVVADDGGDPPPPDDEDDVVEDDGGDPPPPDDEDDVAEDDGGDPPPPDDEETSCTSPEQAAPRTRSDEANKVLKVSCMLERCDLVARARLNRVLNTGDAIPSPGTAPWPGLPPLEGRPPARQAKGITAELATGILPPAGSPH
ncbi:hypothetical protein WMF37_19285 [Sorangium sp. So ce291]|uniref:hypothetical protein n=1 Tax=Sorangium sp. So ce291 TaxID=3133294 RepID=UPI003F647E22